MSLRIDGSKTDRLRLGAVVHIAAVEAGVKDKEIHKMCPVRALLNNLRVHHESI